MPYALQYGMTPYQFWHEDIELFNAYQTAYLRDVSFKAWYNGQYVAGALNVVLGNAFAKKGAKKIEYPEWQDPMQNIEKKTKKKSKEEIEKLYRQQQVEQNNWLHKLKTE